MSLFIEKYYGKLNKFYYFLKLYRLIFEKYHFSLYISFVQNGVQGIALSPATRHEAKSPVGHYDHSISIFLLFSPTKNDLHDFSNHPR